MGTPAPRPSDTPDANLRISDADRHKVADLLREAAGEGRLEISELEERIEATYKAKTYADLVPITVDLPMPEVQAPVALTKPVAGPPELYAARPVAQEFHPCILSGYDRKGVWTVPASTSIVAILGGADLDMREAQFSARETVVTVNTVMGGVNVVVGPEVHVVMEVVGVLGGASGPDSVPETADGPVLRVKGFALLGGVNVERKQPKRSRSSPKQLR